METLAKQLIEDKNFELLMKLISDEGSRASCTGGGGGAGDCGSCQVS
ncbi:hypothetical protein [Fluviispira multicolorata]|nr:hypothetical protein [Fluviispira multicolorata]